QPEPYALSSVTPVPDAPGRHLVYVEIWERSVSAVEDPALREVALGALDTVVRTQIAAAVRHAPVPPGGDSAALLAVASTGSMYAEHHGLVQPSNALYRVEVWRGGAAGDDSPPVFTWSKSNGATVIAVAARERGASTVSLMPGAPGLAPNTLVEYLDATYTATGRRGPLLRVESATATTVTFEAEPPAGVGTDPSARPFLRVWDEMADVVAGEPLLLEDGVEVTFGSGTYVLGDYWWVPTRTDTGVVWPHEHGHPVPRPPDGVERLRAPLAHVDLGDSVVVHDLRATFAPAGEVTGDVEPPEPVSAGPTAHVPQHSAAPRSAAPGGGEAVLVPAGHLPEGWTGTGQLVAATTRWSPPRPFARAIDTVVALVPYEDDLILVTTDQVWVVPGGTERAERLAELPMPREGFGCFVTGGALYVVGGRLRDVRRPDGALLRYDLEADTWTAVRAMPHPVCDAVVALLHGRAHVIGGRRPGWLLAHVARHHQVYDVAGDRWVAGERLPGRRYAAAGAVTRDRLHVLGGIGRRGLFGLSPRADHMVLNLGSGSWSVGVPLPEPRAWAGAAVDGDGRLVVAGGADAQEWTERVFVHVSGERTWHRADPLANTGPCRAAATPDGAVAVAAANDGLVTAQRLPAPVTYEVVRRG
ncbi:MAG: hypothetical protein JO074_09290, partial [Frankiales bacterium]|nr:hypothetical protein [Frankiales bacterium]